MELLVAVVVFIDVFASNDDDDGTVFSVLAFDVVVFVVSTVPDALSVTAVVLRVGAEIEDELAPTFAGLVNDEPIPDM